MKFTTIASLATAASLLALGVGGVQAKTSQACAADVQRMCPTAAADKHQARQCIKAHMNEVSPDCRSAVEAAKARHQQRKAAKASAMQSAPSGEEPAPQ
jgi:hypothetical protein